MKYNFDESEKNTVLLADPQNFDTRIKLFTRLSEG